MPSLAEFVRAIEGIGAAASIGNRTVLGLDTNTVPADWSHITKIDPELAKQLPLAYPLYLQHTGAVSVGGSRDVTDATTEQTFDLMDGAGVTAFHEPSAASHVTDRTRKQADFLALPEVLNGDSEALVGTLGQGIEHVKDELAPTMIREKLPVPVGAALTEKLSNFAAAWLLREAVFEAYIIMNADSAAAREANVGEDDLLTPAEARQRALAAEHHLESEVVYLEYSGTFGGDEAVEILETLDDALTWPRIWYGGGLANRADAQRVLDAGADAVIVGNAFHDVAPEEAALYEAALEDLSTDASRADVEAWVETQVDPAETNAAKFLSTVAEVPDPDARAVRYLAAGVHVGLQLRALADGFDEPTEADLRRALSGDSIPGETVFTDALADDARPLARRLGLSLLAETFDVDVADGFESQHLAVEL